MLLCLLMQLEKTDQVNPQVTSNTVKTFFHAAKQKYETLPLHTSPANLTILCPCCLLPWLQSLSVWRYSTVLFLFIAEKSIISLGGGWMPDKKILSLSLSLLAFWRSKMIDCIFKQRVNIHVHRRIDHLYIVFHELV